MIDLRLHTDLTDFYKEIDAVQITIEEKIPAILEIVGTVVVNWLQETSPSYGFAAPISSSEGPREQHPGGWADRRSHLNRATKYRVIKGNGRYTLRFSNNMAYAVYVDALEGRFVLSGVADSPDSPAVRELNKALRIALPDWKINVS